MSYGTPQDTPPCVKVELISHVEVTLDHAVKKVWPYILRWDSFVDDKDFIPHRVAGAPDAVGEVKGVSHFDKTGRMDSLFFVKTIKIVPNQQMVLKVLSPEYVYDVKTGISTEVPQTGYEVFNIYEKDGRTIFTLDCFVEAMPPGITEDDVQRIAEQFQADTANNWDQKYFPRLKKLLAQS
jgi:hypothetical protein